MSVPSTDELLLKAYAIRYPGIGMREPADSAAEAELARSFPDVPQIVLRTALGRIMAMFADANELAALCIEGRLLIIPDADVELQRRHPGLPPHVYERAMAYALYLNK